MKKQKKVYLKKGFFYLVGLAFLMGILFCGQNVSAQEDEPLVVEIPVQTEAPVINIPVTTENPVEIDIPETSPSGIDANANVKTDSTGKLRVHFLNVDHGTATLVECDNQYLLIDAGPVYKYDQKKEDFSSELLGEVVYDYLDDMGIGRLDYVIASHPHADHIGALNAILEDYEIGKIYMPDVPYSEIRTSTYQLMLNLIDQKQIEVEYPSPMDQFYVGGAQVTVLSPEKAYYTDANNYSIVVRIVYGNNSFLLTADALKEAESEMMAAGYELKSDVLQVPHHSIAGVTAQSTDHLPFLGEAAPKYSVISNNVLASWTVLEKLRKTSDVYTTYQNGHIVMESDGVNLTIITQKKENEPTYYATDILKVENESEDMGFVGEGGDGSVKVYYRHATEFTFSGHYGPHSYQKIEYMPVKENETYDPKGNWKEGDHVTVENGFRGRIFVRFLNEKGNYVVTKTNGFAVDETGMSGYEIVCNKNERIGAVRVGKVNKKALICRGKTTLRFSAEFGPSGKKWIAYQVVSAGEKYRPNGKWIKGEQVVLKKGFKGNVYVKYKDNCNRVKVKKTQLFRVLKKK